MPTALGDIFNERGMDLELRYTHQEMTDPLRMALVLKCGIGQIARTLMLQSVKAGNSVLFVVSGRNQISMRKASLVIGDDLERPTPDFIHEKSGYPGSSIPPIGLRAVDRIIVDPDLLRFYTAWFPAGMPRVWFKMRTDMLLREPNAISMDVKVKHC